MTTEHRNEPLGIGYILIAWLLFTSMTIVTRYAAKTVPLANILFFQNVIGFMTVLPWLKSHGWNLLRTEKFGLIFFRSIVSLVAVWLSFIAVQKISLVNTMLFNNSSPLWLPFVILVWLKLPIRHILWPGLIGGFVGIVLILQPGKEVFNPGALYALGAGVLQSINMISLRLLSKTERNHTVLFYYFLICSLVCLPFTIFEWVTPTFTVGMEILAIGLLFTLGQWAFVRAFHHAKAALLAPFCYSGVVFAVLIDWGFFGQIPNLLAWIGIALVCAGGIWALKTSQPPSLPQS